MNSTICCHPFSIKEARSLVKDLSRPKQWIYWCDFLVSILVGHAAFHLMLNLQSITGLSGTAYWGTKLALFAVVSILYMRSVMFIHELVHLPQEGWKGFRIAWNLLCGIPFLVPSFLYYPHVDHHRRKHYGTERDGEYLDLSHRPASHCIAFLLAALVVPLAAFVRFAMMTPLAWVAPGFRGWVEKHASSMIIDIFYLRGDFGPGARRIMRLQEVACFLWCMVIVLRAPIASGQLVDGFLLHAYPLAVTLIFINNIRTLGAHRWTGDGRELSFEEQLLDSVNYPYRPWFTELWGPVGTRYHALHHLFPSIPYHNLGIAHRRLAAGLPEDSPYHATTRVSLVQAIWELLERTGKRQLRDGERNQEQQSASLGNDSQAA